VEFLADDAGHWMFHCHILYHMMSGMARVFRYVDEPEASPTMAAMDRLGEHGRDMSYLWGAAMLQTNMTEGTLTWMNPKNDLMLTWEAGWDQPHDTEYELDLLYQRYFNMNLQAFAGWRWSNQIGTTDRAVAGVTYRLPLMIWANASLDSEGDARMTLSKRLQLTPRLGVWGEAFFDTGTQWEWSVGADYTLTRTLSLSASHHSDHGSGVGLLIRF
jgi:hypothetical protein